VTMKLRILLLLLLMNATHLHAQVLSDSLTLQTSIIDQIIITGNKKTRSYIVQRELTFHKGDTLAPFILESAIERTRQNLMNTALFNFVEIRYFQGLGNTVVVHINLLKDGISGPLLYLKLPIEILVSGGKQKILVGRITECFCAKKI
jgi:hypothetical protein